MGNEPGNERPAYNGLNPPFSGSTDGAGPGNPNLDRLAPPMFPPGERSQPLRPVPEARLPDGDDGVPEDAFIMPDEPIHRSGDEEAPEEALASTESVWAAPHSAFDSALIDPDAPIVRRRPPRTPADYERVVRGSPPAETDEVVVTGIGDNAHEDDEDDLELPAASEGDPRLADLIRAVKRLSDALGSRGEAGLRTTADMTRFEATLRAYCVGYLTRAREEGEGGPGTG